jgi:hypothetical protein
MPHGWDVKSEEALRFEVACVMPQVSTAAIVWGTLLAILLVLVVMRGSELSKSESRVDKMLELTRERRRMKQSAAFYIQADVAHSCQMDSLMRSAFAA